MTFPKREKGDEALENLPGNEALCRSSRPFFAECNFSLAIGASTSPRLSSLLFVPALPFFSPLSLRLASTESSKNVIVFPQPLNSPVRLCPQRRRGKKKQRNAKPYVGSDSIRFRVPRAYECPGWLRFPEFFP